MNPTIIELINACNEAVETVERLSELGRAIDGQDEYMACAIELLSVISERAGHLSRLLDQLSLAVVPRPQRVEEGQR